MSVPPEAIAVLQKFLDAGMRKDEAAMRTCLTKKTLESGQFNGSGPEGVRFVLGEGVMEAEGAVIPIKGYPLDLPAGEEAGKEPAMQLSAVMVKEDGEWKFDLATTMQRMFGGMEEALQQAVGQMGEVMGGVMEKVGEAMSEAFGGGSGGDAAAAVNYLEAETAHAEEELLPRLEMTELPKQTAGLSAVCGERVPVSAAIDDLLKQVGSDDRKTLIEWFDNSLFEGWQTMFARLNGEAPFAGRLKGIRIEPAKDVESRMVILDGSEVVYRMYLNTTDGYYNDEWLAWALPGILAALPEAAEEAVVGKRLVHLDTEEPSLDLFKERYVPRMMRRICEIVGKNVALEANWDDIFNQRDDVRQLYRWTLNRVVGALAIARRDAAMREKLAAELKGIRIILDMASDARQAKFEDGILEISLQYFRGETGAFYEGDLHCVLAGQPIMPAVSEEAAASDEEEDEQDDEEEGEEDGDEESEEDQEEEEPELDEAARAKETNDINFRTAAASLKENEPTWATQIEMIVERPVTLELNFDSLGGDYALVQPFIHQGMSSVVEAFPALYGEKDKWQGFFKKIAHVVISANPEGEAISAELDGGTLSVRVPLQKADVRPPTAGVIDAFRALNGMTPREVREERAPGTGDLYSIAARFVRELEAAMRQADLWPGKKPPGEIEVRGAFGSENMAFNQWLAWVMIPRVKEIIETRGEFPSGSNVAAYAVREWDGVDYGRVVEVLHDFDDAVAGAK